MWKVYGNEIVDKMQYVMDNPKMYSINDIHVCDNGSETVKEVFGSLRHSIAPDIAIFSTPYNTTETIRVIFRQAIFEREKGASSQGSIELNNICGEVSVSIPFSSSIDYIYDKIEEVVYCVLIKALTKRISDSCQDQHINLSGKITSEYYTQSV